MDSKTVWLHSSKYFISCFTEQRKSYRVGTTWGWVNDDRTVIFGWTIHFKNIIKIIIIIIMRMHVFTNMLIAVEIESVIFRIVINDHINIYSVDYLLIFFYAISVNDGSAQTLFRCTLLSTKTCDTVTYEVTRDTLVKSKTAWIWSGLCSAVLRSGRNTFLCEE